MAEKAESKKTTSELGGDTVVSWTSGPKVTLPRPQIERVLAELEATAEEMDKASPNGAQFVGAILALKHVLDPKSDKRGLALRLFIGK